MTDDAPDPDRQDVHTAAEQALAEASGRSPAALARAFGCGLAMGTADAVPGVSGGTIALILGIYDRFIGALAAVVSVVRNPADMARWRAARRALVFLVPLGAGLATAYLAATRLLVGKVPTPTTAAEAHALRASPPPGWLVNPSTAPVVFAFFFGLVLASVHEPWSAKRTHRAVDWLLGLVGAAVAVALSLSPPAAGSISPAALVGSGAVAVSVMLLPGVSGSLALLVLGMYQPVSGAVHAVYDRETGVVSWDEVGTIAWFLVGLALGVAAFVPLLRWILARAHDRTMSLLSGLMLGSLAALWPWKTHYLPKTIPWEGPMSPIAPTEGWWAPALAALAGAAVIVTMSRVARARAAEQASA